MKITVIWVDAPYSMVDVYQASEVPAACIIKAKTHLDDGGNRHL